MSTNFQPATPAPNPTATDGVTSATSIDSSACDLFTESKLCISLLHNLISHVATDHEVSCQELCSDTPGCEYFTLVTPQPRSPGEVEHECYLWKVCRHSEDCDTPGFDCVASVKGPISPSITTACCPLFVQRERCSSPPFLSLPAEDEDQCQQECRDRADTGCRFQQTLTDYYGPTLQVLLSHPLWLPAAHLLSRQGGLPGM